MSWIKFIVIGALVTVIFLWLGEIVGVVWFGG